MVTPTNGNIFRVTGPLWGEFTRHRWIPLTRPVKRSFDVFFDLRRNKRLSKQSRRRWFETPSRSLLRHCNGQSILVDTLFAYQDLPTSLRIQLAQIYAKFRDKLEIISFVKTHVSGNDYGAFAIANMVKFCMGNIWRDEESSSRGNLCQETLRFRLVTFSGRKKFSVMDRDSCGKKSYYSYSIEII